MRVSLTYFKPSGKWYAGGELVVDVIPWGEVIERVVAMHVEGRLPGLVAEAGRDMYVLVRLSDSEVPHLLRPIEMVTCCRCGARPASERRVDGVDVGTLCQGCWRSIVRNLGDEAR